MNEHRALALFLVFSVRQTAPTQHRLVSGSFGESKPLLRLERQRAFLFRAEAF